MAAAGAVYAATVMITNAYNHHGVIQAPVIVAAVGAVAALLTRQAVTPVKDPRDGNGAPLAPAPIPAAPDAPFTVAPRLPENVTVVPQTAADETVTPPGM
jgi:hypothetical protein